MEQHMPDSLAKKDLFEKIFKIKPESLDTIPETYVQPDWSITPKKTPTSEGWAPTQEHPHSPIYSLPLKQTLPPFRPTLIPEIKYDKYTIQLSPKPKAPLPKPAPETLPYRQMDQPVILPDETLRNFTESEMQAPFLRSLALFRFLYEQKAFHYSNIFSGAVYHDAYNTFVLCTDSPSDLIPKPIAVVGFNAHADYLDIVQIQGVIATKGGGRLLYKLERFGGWASTLVSQVEAFARFINCPEVRIEPYSQNRWDKVRKNPNSAKKYDDVAISMGYALTEDEYRFVKPML